MNNLVIYFIRRNVYGNELIYPADKDQAFYLEMVTGTKTLSPVQREGLAGLGIRLVECVEVNGVITPLSEVVKK